MTRISWDEYFGNIITEVSKRSTCIRHQFGAVIVNENHQIISTGYNGPMRGALHCSTRKDGCDSCGVIEIGNLLRCSKDKSCEDFNWKFWEPKYNEVICIKDKQNIESGKGHDICPAVHAEQNALLQAGKESKGATLYINGYPCKICARLIVNAGIIKVVCSGDYSDKEGIAVLESVSVEVILND